MGKSTLRNIFIILGVVAFVAGVAFVVYKYFFEDKDDDFLDDIDDKFIDDDDDPFDDIVLAD